MATNIIIPKFGWMMTEGTIVKWHKAEGDYVAEGDVLFEVTTDKSVMDVESNQEGYLLKVLVPEGGSGKVGETVAYMGEEGEDVSALVSESPASAEETAPAKEAAPAEAEVKAAPKTAAGGKVLASPADKVLAKKNGIDIQEAFAGEDKIIKKKDVQKYIDEGAVKMSPLARSIADKEGIDVDGIKGTGVNGKIMADDVRGAVSRPAAEVPAAAAATQGQEITGMRRIISERMSQSSNETAPVTYSRRINMENIIALKDTLKARAAEEGVKITLTDVLVKVIATGLTKYKNINVTFSDNIITQHDDVNMGIAVALDEGLLVPVLKAVDKRSIIDIAKEREVVVKNARVGKIAPENMGGGTFTISNLGSYEVDFFTPIIDIPQVAILGIGKTQDEVVVIDKEICIKPMAYFSLVADHRVVDGAPAVEFLGHLKAIIENPIGYIV